MAVGLFVRCKEPSPWFIRGRIRISKARHPNSVRVTIAPASQPAVDLTFQIVNFAIFFTHHRHGQGLEKSFLRRLYAMGKAQGPLGPTPSEKGSCIPEGRPAVAAPGESAFWLGARNLRFELN